MATTARAHGDTSRSIEAMPDPAFPISGKIATFGRVTMLLLTLTLAATLAVGRLAVVRLRSLLASLEAIGRQIEASRATQDHHAESLDRRMRAVEASAATSEREARMISLQMVDLNRVMVQQADILITVRNNVMAERSGANSAHPLRAPVDRLPEGGPG
jgi:cell division protein FtsB